MSSVTVAIYQGGTGKVSAMHYIPRLPTQIITSHRNGGEILQNTCRFGKCCNTSADFFLIYVSSHPNIVQLWGGGSLGMYTLQSSMTVRSTTLNRY
jgi:hypothetical protein